MAREITAGEDNYYRRVMLIRDYLKGNYFYSLKPGMSAEGNQLHHFLFNSQKGYCSYFAFAMALLCRSIGIPARVAVGFYVLIGGI
jgi:transglutaminase-like putative cysteine protease